MEPLPLRSKWRERDEPESVISKNTPWVWRRRTDTLDGVGAGRNKEDGESERLPGGGAQP